nr:DUF1016 N-terminal domain-containing protein [Halomonas sp.]
MRQFYQSFPKRHAVSTELSWTHYLTLLRVENVQASDWYLHEAITKAGALKNRTIFP